MLAPPSPLAAARATPRLSVSLPTVYAASLVVWLVSRGLVLVHQGAWPWMNAFVVAAARGIVVGDWNDAVRPQLPAVLGVPLVLVGADEQTSVAVLYVIASLIQFVAFVVVIRALFPNRLLAQTLALLFFLLVPYNHSIHHYRDMPVVLASSGVFLLAALWLHGSRNLVWILGATLLGVWSRTEVATFVLALAGIGLLVWRRRAVRMVALFAGSAVVAVVSLAGIYRVEGVDATPYLVHTFLDSTPESWLSPACRADPTENCRAADGLRFFGPADAHTTLGQMILNHPLTTLAKTARSAWDNLWTILGPNVSTFPGTLPFIVLMLALVPTARELLRGVPAAAWMVVAAVLAETVLPPLSWAPPHPQYHLQLVLAVIIVLVPVLLALARWSRGRWLVLAFFVGNAALSAFRYTRYPGY